MQEKGNNVINNYKGVMLCSRPNEVNQNRAEKPFCGRVVPPQQIGLVPTKQDKPQRQSPKKKITHLQKHKKWLNDFQKLQRQKKQNDVVQKVFQQEKFKKIKEQAQIDRQRSKKMKNQYNETANNVLQILDGAPASKPAQLNAENLRKLNEKNEIEASEQFKKKKNKNEKPLWAMTEKEVQHKQQEEVDQLINFFDTNEVKDYTEDEEVQKILNNLKQKIQAIKQQQNWKEKQAQRVKEKQQKNQQQRDDRQDDKYSNFSVKSEARSVASEKTQQKIQQLRDKLDKKKKGQDQWDKHTTTSKHTATIEDRIAKNLADQVLRNYPNLRGVHSNTSIRKLLQAEAARAINQPIKRPVITTIIKEKIPMDSNNLPYLHRNPAI